MKKITLIISCLCIAAFIVGCSKKEYSLGDLTPPSDIVINAEIVGQSTATPDGDGSGVAKFTIAGKNVIAYKIDYGTTPDLNYESITTMGTVTKKFAPPKGISGTFPFTITLVAFGKGGDFTTVTKTIRLRIDFTVPQDIETKLLGSSSKTWVVDKSVPGHLGVGPWSGFTPNWWAAGVNEKEATAPGLYTATYKFSKLPDGSYTLQVTAPDGIFAKGTTTNLPFGGVNEEKCFPYAGSTKAFSFGPATSGIPLVPAKADDPKSTQVNIMVTGNDGFIGYGSCSNTYEILELTETTMYLRSQGAVEKGNAWYLKLKTP
ncbi:MAG: hypothetical protein K2Q03_00035 [Sphingobacteriaceae bacterium]|nr:hypothetical protein [Sphingobacteriaceae bacterium]